MTTRFFSAQLALAGAMFMISDTSAFADTRIVETTFGTVEVPSEPVRIVTTHYIATQPLVDLGILPIGQGPADPTYVIPEHWALLADIPVVSQGAELNFEQIALLEPDLIFTTNSADSERIARLRQIAPVIQIGVSGPDRSQWQSRARQIADAVNRLADWEALDAAFVTRQQEIATTYAQAIAAHPVAIIGAWGYDAGNVRLFPANTMVGNVLSPTGTIFAASAEAVANDDGSDVVFGTEEIGGTLADAEVIFYNVQADGSDNPAATDLLASQIYRTATGAVAGREFPIGQITIGGYGDANATLDFYVRALEAL